MSLSSNGLFYYRVEENEAILAAAEATVHHIELSDTCVGRKWKGRPSCCASTHQDEEVILQWQPAGGAAWWGAGEGTGLGGLGEQWSDGVMGSWGVKGGENGGQKGESWGEGIALEQEASLSQMV